ncbi:MAG: 2-succinyl-5-enolpyruvyl-6-hydroxy-3-cyclohexene-1-carboxylic-acid synthase [Algoriphagus sp.]|nr:2-succinyl-5-enolpyruvyl-6-hydroxy-3-cyclohexene-1-carboxylic-acid synthase [Algoriphagus sp.]
MILQPILDLVAICAAQGIRHVLLSPGSRCAPLTLAFARHPKMEVRTISDERSAAFIALGMAQQLKQPVVLVCTSGSAVLNYFPAIAEAFFQQIPLLVLTADRPPEWVDQWDGQTIFQEEVYGKHVKKSYRFPDTFTHPDQVRHAHRISNEAILLSQQFPAGPVHLNIPLREPFYPEEGETFNFPMHPPLFTRESSEIRLSEASLEKLKVELAHFRRILIVPGQQEQNLDLLALIERLALNQQAVVVADSLSNLQGKGTITLHDQWLGREELHPELAPDLVISFGKSIISKSLKLFLRKLDIQHWHIQPDGQAKDTYSRLTRIVASDPLAFLTWLASQLPSGESGYAQGWQALEEQVARILPQALQEVEFGEYPAVKQVLDALPAKSQLQVANSMAIRYVNFLGRRSQEIFCNRGTSGIDGSSSTAVGASLVSSSLITLLTGDMAFFYDRNAFWHKYPLPNLRIVLLNNHSGGIFRLIDGPAKQPELEEFFETQQALSASHLAAEYGFKHYLVKNSFELDQALATFFEPSAVPKILEIESQSQINARSLKEIKAKMVSLLKT